MIKSLAFCDHFLLYFHFQLCMCVRHRMRSRFFFIETEYATPDIAHQSHNNEYIWILISLASLLAVLNPLFVSASHYNGTMIDICCGTKPITIQYLVINLVLFSGKMYFHLKSFRVCFFDFFSVKSPKRSLYFRKQCSFFKYVINKYGILHSFALAFSPGILYSSALALGETRLDLSEFCILNARFSPIYRWSDWKQRM